MQVTAGGVAVSHHLPGVIDAHGTAVEPAEGAQVGHHTLSHRKGR